MTDQAKKTTNITVEQMIEHMTADIQNADGQYIQLGFTPPSTPNDSHNWPEYSQNQLPQNPFVPHFTPRTAETLTYIDPNARYMSQNVAYSNYMAQNAIYVPDLQNNAYEKHLNMDMHGKYVLYSNQQPQYVMTNPDIPVCGFMPVYPENRDYALFANQEIQNLQMQQSAVLSQNTQNTSEQLYMPENVMLQQNHQEALKSKILMHQNIQPQQNRTHLIENLVCNWAQNTNGTYSPFGNAPPQNTPNFFETAKPDLTSINNPQLNENSSNLIDSSDRSSDFNLKNFKTPVNKKKQIAEVKPMRPTYSDVLTKSVPQQTPKMDKIESVKDTKTKNSVKKNLKNDKFAKISLNRQSSTNGDKENLISNGQKFEKNSDSKVNLPRKWVSLDDVNEVHTNNDLFKVPDLSQENSSSKNSVKKNKKFESPNLKNENGSASKNGIKKSFLDNSSLGCQWTESEDVSESSKNDERNINKNPTKKGKEGRISSVRQVRERISEKPPGSGKRNQRVRKRDTHNTFGVLGRTVQHYVSHWSRVVFCVFMWLLHLISDIFSMSVHLGRDFGTMFCDSFVTYTKSFMQSATSLLKRVKVFTKIGQYIDKTFGGYKWAFWKSKEKERRNSKVEGKNWLNSGLEHNIPMPSTGEEAMKRLLACKGKDPYSILGVRPDCTDDDIKRYYKRQAFLVHPDKNPQPGAEEAFKILVHAFDIIGEPERRQSYDRKVAESHQVEQAWSELNDLLSQLHQKMEYAANTIRCTNCSKRHRRLSVDRPCYAARMCSQCKIHHSAKEGDIWAEAKYFGFLWHYYACMDGAVYDITEWAGCQRKNLKHLRPNSHNVQYRIVLGKQGQAGGSSNSHRRGHKSPGNNGEREADLENFLNNLYNQSDMSGSGNTPSHSDVSARGATDAARSRKKNKRKK